MIELGDEPLKSVGNETLAQRCARSEINDPKCTNYIFGLKEDELESVKNRKKFLLAHPNQITAKYGTQAEEDAASG